MVSPRLGSGPRVTSSDRDGWAAGREAAVASAGSAGGSAAAKLNAGNSSYRPTRDGAAGAFECSRRLAVTAEALAAQSVERSCGADPAEWPVQPADRAR